MTFDPEQVRIEPEHETRRWQSCDYFTADGVRLFHERTYARTAPRGVVRTLASALWLADSDMSSSQWIEGQDTRAKVEALALKHGGEARECFYSMTGDHPDDNAEPLYFLSFNDTDKALAFCQTDDFDRLAYPLRAGAGLRAD